MQNKWYKWIVLFIVQWMVWKFLFQFPTFIDFWFNYPYQLYYKIIHSITSGVTIPMGEIFYGLFIIFILFVFIQCIRSQSYRYSLNLCFKVFTYILLWYNSVWGFMYYKENYIVEKQEINPEILKELYCEALEQAIYHRESFNASHQPIKFKVSTNDILSEFGTKQYAIQHEKWIKNYHFIEQPIVKLSFISSLMNHLGILGYYNPFSIESNINRNNTDLKHAYTINHELAHQMGFSSENEANFIAYYLSHQSKFSEVVYAANYKLMFSILSALSLADPLFVEFQLNQLPESIQNDRKGEIKYYQQFEGKTSEVFSEMNNQFLKANNQEGIITYSKYIDLVYYYKTKKANP